MLLDIILDIVVFVFLAFIIWGFILAGDAFIFEFKEYKNNRRKNKNKPYREWKVIIKKEFCELPIYNELHGPYDLDDVKDHFGLEEPDVDWYNIEEIKNE